MKWINDTTPTNEEPILILTEHKFCDGKGYIRTIVRGFYTDGEHNSEDSDYGWYDMENWEYDEENDAYIIPQGYWEERWYGNGEDSVAVIDDKVVGWCRLKDVINEAKIQLKENKNGD